MRTNENKIKYYIITLFVCVSVNLIFPYSAAEAVQGDSEIVDFSKFQSALDDKSGSEALSIGEENLKQLEYKYSGDAGFRAFKSKYDAAIFLADQMQQQLKKATGMRMASVANEVFNNNVATEEPPLSIPPAKSFYDTSNRIFRMTVSLQNLTNEEKSFLSQYYNLKLKNLTSNIAKTGQALAIADPAFQGTHDYVLVLPLLHASEEKPINIDILPQWMQQPEQLDIFVDSCLLHFGLPFQAMNIARRSAQLRDHTFSELNFYKLSATKCGIELANIAGDCLERAIVCAQELEPDNIINIKFDTVQLWLDSENYPLAAGEARSIYEEYPEHGQSGKAIWLYYYALSRSNNINEILVGIDATLDDGRCMAYKPKLMYIKWWALRRQRDQAERVAVLEYELLKEYGDDPMVAPILLSRATDLLAGQDYTGAYDLLNQLVEKFPTTAASTQAGRMLEKLKNIQNHQ